MEIEARYVMARLRAVEERLKYAAESAPTGDQEEGSPRAGAYLSGYARGLLEARDHVRRLREGFAHMYPID